MYPIHYKNDAIHLGELVIKQNDYACLLTRSDSAETSLFQAFDELVPENLIAIVSYQRLQKVYEHELEIDETDLTDEIDAGTLGKEFLPESELDNPLIKQLNMADKLDTGFRYLSTGESLKLLILQAALTGKKFIVLQNPFDSIDVKSREVLNETLAILSETEMAILLLLNNHTDIPNQVKKVALLRSTEIELLDNVSSQVEIDSFYRSSSDISDWPCSDVNHQDNYQHDYLCDLRDCTVTYQGQHVFENINLSVRPFEHTLITGKNGAGKSTLLQLITGDCPQCYSNDVTVFGYRRGNGESIWDIKQHIGIVSSDLHRSYRIRVNTLTVVVSGLHDSIGVYKSVAEHQLKLAERWLEIIDLIEHATIPFHALSQGQQRLVLIARALIKCPLLLILDEPTQGLDESCRHLVLQFIEKLVAAEHTTILLVSHREDEHLPVFRQVINLDKSN